jgi:hypothetical protein
LTDGAPKKTKERGRPPAQTDEEIAHVLELVGSEGITLKEAAEKSGAAYTTIRGRIAESKELSLLYAQAREDFAETMVTRLFKIASEEEDVQRARLKCDNIKWYAQRVLPRLYGEKHEVTGKDGTPLVPASDILNDAREILFALQLASREQASRPTQH